MSDLGTSSIPDVAVIIVTYNASLWIKNCINSVMNSNLPAFIIVVDNKSEDDTVSRVKGFEAKNVICLEQNSNLGFGQANNIGISYALNGGAEFTFLLNQDAHIEPDTLDKLVNVAKRFPNYGILSPLHLNKDGSKIDKRFAQHVFRHNGESFFFDPHLGHNLAEIYDVDFLNAAAWLVGRDFWLKVGGFDPLYFMYSEDDDLCFRAKLHGFKIGLVPTAKIHHYRERSNVKHSSFRMLRIRSTIASSRMIQRLKTSPHPFFKRLLGLTIDSTFEFFRLLFRGSFTAAIVIPIAYIITIAKIRKIYLHIQSDKLQSCHWLTIK